MTTLAGIPMCRICMSYALNREATEAEDIADAEERGDIAAPRTFRHRGPAQ